jgi:hypothetical protein
MPIATGDDEPTSVVGRWPRAIAIGSSVAIITVFMISSSMFDGSLESTATAPLFFVGSETDKYGDLGEIDYKRLFKRFMEKYEKNVSR